MRRKENFLTYEPMELIPELKLLSIYDKNIDLRARNTESDQTNKISFLHD